LLNLARLNLSSSVEINSGHGVHWYWLLSDSWEIKIDNIAYIQTCHKWRELQYALIDFCSSDYKITAIPQFLRMPESNNIKYGDNIKVMITSQTNKSFKKEDFNYILKLYQEKQFQHEQAAKQELATYDREHYSIVRNTVIDILSAKVNVNDYCDWLNLAMSLKSEGFSYREVDKVFIGSLRHNYGKNEMLYNKMNPNKISFDYAYNLARLLSNSIYKDISKKIDECK